MLRILQLRSVWRVEPWTGALNLDLQAAWSALERLAEAPDPDAAGRYFDSFERGACAGWAKVRKRKD